MLSPQFLASILTPAVTAKDFTAAAALPGLDLSAISRGSLERARLAEQTRANQAGESTSRRQVAIGEGNLALNREEFQAKRDSAAEAARLERQAEFAKFQERYNDAIGRLDGGKTEQLKLEGQAKGYEFGEVSEGGSPGDPVRTWRAPGDELRPVQPATPPKRFLTVSDPASKASVKIDPEGLRASRDQTFDTIFKGAVTYNQPLWQEALQLARVGSKPGMEAPMAAELYMNLREQQNKLEMVKANKRGSGAGGPAGAGTKANSQSFSAGRATMAADAKHVQELAKAERDLYTAMDKLKSGTPVEINDLKYALARANDPTARAQSDADIKNSAGFQNLSWLDQFGLTLSQKGAGSLSSEVRKQLQTAIRNSMARASGYLNDEYQVKKEMFAGDPQATDPSYRRGIRSQMRAFGPRFKQQDFMVEGDTDEDEKKPDGSAVLNILDKH